MKRMTLKLEIRTSLMEYSVVLLLPFTYMPLIRHLVICAVPSYSSTVAQSPIDLKGNVSCTNRMQMPFLPVSFPGNLL